MDVDAQAADDGAMVSLVTESLLPGGADATRRLFAMHGLRAPQVLWSPDPQDLDSAFLRRFWDICQSWAGPDGRVPDTRFNMAALDALTDWLMVLSADAEDLRYEFYGPRIQASYGRDMTGQSVRAFGGHISQFFEGLYRAAQERREWVLSEHEPPRSVFVRAWRRLIVPLFAADGETVIRFAVLNLPDNGLRAGLELIPDPVFVADDDQRVHFLNSSAQRFFATGPVHSPGPTLRALTGIPLENQESPESLLTSGTIAESVQLTLRGGIAERLLMTVSAAEYRGRAFYIVVMRLVPA